MRVCVQLQWMFLKTLSTCLPISRWVIYSAPAHAMLSIQQFLTKTQRDPYTPPSLFTWSHPSNCSLFPWKKKVLKGKHCTHVEEVKQNMAEALKSIQIDEFQNCLEQWKNVSIGVLHHVKINTQFLINKFWFWGSPSCIISSFISL